MLTKENISDSFLEEIDLVLNKKYKSNNQVKVRNDTPEVLVKQGVKNLPMLITSKHIKSIIYSEEEAKKYNVFDRKIAHYHGLGKDTFIKVMMNLDSPLEIYKQSKNNYLIITEILDNYDKNIIVPIEINSKGTYNDVYIDENQIKSAYGKNHLKRYLHVNKFKKIYTKKELP